jgi:DNA-binding NtrC family response regulator
MRLACISSGKSTDPVWLGAFDGLDVEHWIAPEGLDRLRGASCDAAIVTLPLADCSAEQVLEQIQRFDPRLPVIFYGREGSSPDAVRLIRLGAFHVLTKDDPEEVRQVLESAAASVRLHNPLPASPTPSEPWRKYLVGESPAMLQVLQKVRLIGPRKSTVLISGETGAGKEMVARAIHMASDRAQGAMVAVNCSALPENLLEAELFGHVKGAFTGAVNHRVGRFEQAHRGTLFLDEIGDLPLEVQAKLLRVLQEREFQRIGSSETIKVDVRVIAATNVDLAQAVRAGRFREDLYYRLHVVPIRVPALRERRADIPALVHHLIDKICRQEGLPPKSVGRDTLQHLAACPWPGNVRQLENAVEMAIALSGDRGMLFPSDFPLPSEPQLRSGAAAAIPSFAVPEEGLDFELTFANLQRAILEQALLKTGGNKAQAAGMLGLKRTTLSAKLRSLARPA